MEDLVQGKEAANANWETVKAVVGWNGLVIRDQQLPVLDILNEYLQAVQDKSCGRCVPCRIGSKMMLDITGRMAQGDIREDDSQVLARLSRLAIEGSMCEFGRSFPKPVQEYLNLGEEGRQAGAQRRVGGSCCEAVMTAPCITRCPAQLDVPDYVQAIKEGAYEVALARIREKTFLVGVLGRICPAYCESGCRRGALDAAINARSLKRFVADFEAGLRRRPAGKPVLTGPMVAVVGAGPAGMSAAYQLVLQGYQVTIFDSQPVAGGMLVRIPAYRLPREVIAREIGLLEDLGVAMQLNTTVGQDIQLRQLQEQYQAVLLATGLPLNDGRSLVTNGASRQSCWEGLDFLRRVNTGKPDQVGARTAVVGEGRLAIDCARSARRLGAEVTVWQTQPWEAELEEEWQTAQQEGIQLRACRQIELWTEQDQVRGLVCDAEQVAAEAVIAAAGQLPDSEMLAGAGLELAASGIIAVDELTLATNLPGVFACGDVAGNGGSVVAAIAAGNRAARSIDGLLKTGRLTPQRELDWAAVAASGIFPEGEKVIAVGGRDRVATTTLAPAERHNFAEVEAGYAAPAAVREAERCLRCYRLTLVVR